MTGSTSPLGFPYPDGGNTLHEALTQIPQQLAEALDDYLSALAAVAPTAPVTFAPITGWSGTIQYARRAGMVTIALQVTRDGGNFSAGDSIAQMPAGFRPVFDAETVGQYGSPRPWSVSPAGVIKVDGSGTYTGGIFGSITYPV